MIDYYQTLAQPAQAEYRDRGSRFIAYATPVHSIDDCKNRLNQIRKEHPKATHHCFAYRLGVDRNLFRSSDDGEPSGTAGKPILGQIDSRSLTDVQVIVVRYFGGTQLGVPGLIHAYRSAAVMALQLSPTLRKPILSFFMLEFDYTRTNDVMRLVRELQLNIQQQQQELFSRWEVGVPLRNMQLLQERLMELPWLRLTAV